MNTTRDLDQLLRDHFGDRADQAVLDGQLDGILLQTADLRQRPGWLAALRSPSMTTQAIAVRAAVPRVVWLAVLVALTLAVLLAAAFVAGGHPAGSPLNGRLLFGRFEAGSSTGGSIFYTVDPDGSHLVQLRPEVHDSARWSPDGKTVLLSESFENADRTTTYTVSVVNADGSDFRTLPAVGSYAPLNLACSDWSPDATRVLCEGWDYTDHSRSGLYTIRSSDGGDLVRVTTPPDSHDMHGSFSPTETSGRDIPGTYSPDGKMIAFAGAVAPATNGTTGIEAQQDGLMVVNTDGTGRRRVGTLVIGDRAEWSPDGRSILVVSTRVYSVDVATGLATPLTIKDQPDARLGTATWSPDGARILFAKFGGGAVFYTMRLDGTDLIEVTGAGGTDWGTHPLGD
jgi:hypothetical protein